MLKDLVIMNGDIGLSFDPLNTIYTVNLTDDANILKFQYEINENDNISIFGNELKNGLNEVVITVYNDKEEMSYYLYVYKEKTLNASENIDTKTALNIVGKEKVSDYALPSISVICFLTILLFFTLLFKKNKKSYFL